VLKTPPLPYALTPPSFRFPALAALTGRLPLGAGREAVMAVLLSARIAGDADGSSPISAGARRARAAAAHQWLAASCPDARIRAACTALTDASVAGDPAALAEALARVMEVTAGYLDAGARSELRDLGNTFR
jgi:hypothetical protein